MQYDKNTNWVFLLVVTFLLTMRYEMRLEQLCKYHANIFWIKMLPNQKKIYFEKRHKHIYPAKFLKTGIKHKEKWRKKYAN